MVALVAFKSTILALSAINSFIFATSACNSLVFTLSAITNSKLPIVAFIVVISSSIASVVPLLADGFDIFPVTVAV